MPLNRILGVAAMASLSPVIWLMVGTMPASAQLPCTSENLASHLETIRSETVGSEVTMATHCAVRLALTRETAQVLSNRLDRTLEEIRRLSPGDRTDAQAGMAAALAEALYALKTTEGYEKIARYFASADWNSRRDQTGFHNIALYGGERSGELTETFYLALSLMPASDLLGRACSAFNRIHDRSVVRDEPRFIHGVLSALVRLEHRESEPARTPIVPGTQEQGVRAGVILRQAGPRQNYAKDSCEKTLLSQLLDEKMRQAFLASFLDQLSADERHILDRFLAKIAPPPDAEVIDQLTAAFFAVPWKVESSIWQQSNPQIQCEVFRGDGSYRGPDDLWCVACSSKSGQLHREFHFYLDAEGKACTLQKARFSYPAASQGVLTALTERLAQRMGPGTPQSDAHGLRSAEEVYFWNWQGREIFVSRDTSGARMGAGLPVLEILARDQELTAAMNLREEVQRLIHFGLIRPQWRLDLRLAQELSDTFPTLPALLAQDSAVQDQEAVRATLLRLLESAKIAPPARRPALLLAADRLADQISSGERHSRQWDQQREQLASYRLTYQWDTLGAVWVYQHDLLWRV